MDIENQIDKMAKLEMEGQAWPFPEPCSEVEVDVMAEQFEILYGVELPWAYQRLLRKANGLKIDGTTIWPIIPLPPYVPGGPLALRYEETIFEANESLRDCFSDDFVYFGTRDEEFYVFDKRTKEYCAIELVGKAVWQTFATGDEMIEFLLHRAWDPCLETI